VAAVDRDGWRGQGTAHVDRATEPDVVGYKYSALVKPVVADQIDRLAGLYQRVLLHRQIVAGVEIDVVVRLQVQPIAVEVFRVYDQIVVGTVVDCNVFRVGPGHRALAHRDRARRSDRRGPAGKDA